MLNGHGGNVNQICDKYGLNPEEIIDFSASINPLGYPEAVRKVVSDRFNDILNYPDSGSADLRKNIAEKVQCNESNVIIGNGSNELFYLIPRALKPEKGIILQPTFSEFKDAFRNAGIGVVEITVDNEDFPLINANLSKLNGVESGMVFLCNPNNPTGQLTQKEDIIELVNQNPNRMIVIDEAFMDFVEDDERYSVINTAPSVNNLIVVRSLTKFYGFPGLRLGYLVANESIVNRLMKYKEPWTVNTFAQIAGKTALNDREFAVRTRQYVSREKVFLYEGLSMINGLQPFKPSVNFVLVKIDDADITSSEVRNLLIENNILIRDCSNFVGLDDKYFRVAVRTREENQELLNVLKLVMDGIASEGKEQKGFAQGFVAG